MKKIHLCILVLLIASTLAGCSSGNSPVGVSKQWIQALSKLDAKAFTGLTCARMQEQSGQLDMWTSLFQMLSMGGEEKSNLLDVSGMKFTETSNDDETAFVQVSGTLKINMGELSQAQPIDETWRLVKEDGKWKWCGSGSQ